MVPAPAGRLRCALAALAALLPWSLSAGAGAPSAAVETYLSEDYFPGLAVLEPLGSPGAGRRLRAYLGGQAPAAAAESAEAVQELDAAGWQDLDAATEAVAAAVGAPPLEPLQTPWAIFDRQGRRLASVEDLFAAPVSFFLEIGVWIWPAVRVGFEQRIQGVGNGTALLRTLSLRPKVFEVRDFLSGPETEEVMELGRQQGLHASKGQMQSRDRDAGTRHDQFRTSKQAWLDNDLAPLVEELDNRVSELTRVPARHNEPVQLLRYGEGNYYHAHMDWTELELYDDQKNMWLSSHFGFQDRLATVFWYLNDVPVGGETFFPKHGQPICKPLERGGPDTRYCEGASDPDMKSCDLPGALKVAPRKGSVIMWYNYHASGRGDRNALHAGCPVGEGHVKWSANKWVRIKPVGSRPAKWMKDHPALRRHGWKGGKSRDPNECIIEFFNAAGEDVSLQWKRSSTGELVKLESVAAGSRSSTNSFRGHEFVLEGASGRITAPVACSGPQVSFEVRPDFSVVPRGRAEL